MAGTFLRRKWQSVPCFGQDAIPNGSKAACELKGKVGAELRGALGGNL